MSGLKAPIPQHAVHLCVDMQLMSTPDGPWPTPWLYRVLPQLLQITGYRPSQTVFTRFLPPRDATEAGGAWRKFYSKWKNITLNTFDQRLLGLLPELADFVPPATVFDKTLYSALSDGRLHIMLQQRRVDTLLISGTETDVCVLATVLSAVDLGYRVIIPQDAICSSSDATHDALLKLYHQRYDTQIETSETDEILKAWNG